MDLTARSRPQPLDLAALGRFLMVGLSNTLVSFLVFRVALAAGLQMAAAAQVLSYSAGIAWSYLWNRRWTFREVRPARRSAGRFVAVQLFLLAVSALLVGLAVDGLRLPATGSWIAVMAIVTVANYLLCRTLVFDSVEARKAAGKGPDRRW